MLPCMECILLQNQMNYQRRSRGTTLITLDLWEYGVFLPCSGSFRWPINSWSRRKGWGFDMVSCQCMSVANLPHQNDGVVEQLKNAGNGHRGLVSDQVGMGSLISLLQWERTLGLFGGIFWREHTSIMLHGQLAKHCSFKSIHNIPECIAITWKLDRWWNLHRQNHMYANWKYRIKKYPQVGMHAAILTSCPFIVTGAIAKRY